ncbi:DUF6622 family protein [Burkholderia sp. Ax-1719]|uniref:DUF6622 family protein n=1 Tax=Burkholderia sp. Ax-1719 TaxID=2608334 RepID=UPI00141EA8B8|nr:DUF6622 family protein [Burkholderia sp. Ax-1719]NIE65226.1 hypothetical protein [Burkholderia sp. Ax-1719]
MSVIEALTVQMLTTEVAAMYLSLIQHTPHWVWGTLAALIVLGVRQSVPRQRSLRSATALPLVMTAFSLYGVVSDFAHEPLALAAWALGAGALFSVMTTQGAWRGVRWSQTQQRLIVPGSWLPLALYLGLFCVKFVVGATLAMHPARVDDADFACLTGLAYGAFSGVFVSRSYAMFRIARSVLTRDAALW